MTDNFATSLSLALKNDDDDQILKLLSSAYKQSMGPEYSIGYALTQMMPPFGDFDIATDVLKSVLKNENETEKVAAIFCGYIYVTLQPFDDDFVVVLQKYKDCAIANYILALYFDYEQDIEKSMVYINHSLSLSRFPNNMLFKLSLYSSDLSDGEREELTTKIPLMVINKCYEQSPKVADIISLQDAYMKELIMGIYMTSINWAYIKNKYKYI